MRYADIVVIGGGPAGMSAAAAAKEAGIDNIIILEREDSLGGILKQCIHNGFGLHKFKEELTGPEYGQRYEDMISRLKIPYKVNTMVVDMTKEKVITAVNREDGFFQIKAGAVILAMGCRERPRGAVNIAGQRPAGVFTAGTAQKIMNIKGFLPGKKIVILGSGDIGLIMARRMTLEGAEVKAVCEIMEDSGGLTRNIVQCLKDFDIPLMLRHTVVEILGKERVEGVTVAEVDINLKPIESTFQHIPCDTLLLSVGLIPENELSRKAGITMNEVTKGPVVDKNRQTNVNGIFACGNVVKVHELVDFVSDEGELAGKGAAAYIKGENFKDLNHSGTDALPQQKGIKGLSEGGEPAVICTVCPVGCRITVHQEKNSRCANKEKISVEGNRCKRGEAYAIREITAPVRTLTTTMISRDGTVVPVKSTIPIPKEKLFDAMKEINSTTFLLPIKVEEIIIENIEGTGADIVAARTFL